MIWQSLFSWRISFCYGDYFRYISKRYLFPCSCKKYKVIFLLALHHENILDLLEPQRMRECNNYDSQTFLTPSLLPTWPLAICQNCPLSNLNSLWFQQILFQVSWSQLWFSVFPCVSRFQEQQFLPYDFNSLVGPREVIDIYVTLPFFLVIKTKVTNTKFFTDWN